MAVSAEYEAPALVYVGLVLQYHYVGLDQMNMNIDSTVVATEGTTICNPPEHC